MEEYEQGVLCPQENTTIRNNNTMAKTKQDKGQKGTAQAVVQETALESVKGLIDTPESVTQLIVSKNKTEINKMFTILGQFAELDHQQEQQSVAAGEVFTKILDLPLDVQKELVGQMADQLGVPRPTYESTGVGRKTKGRNELAQVLYGRWPEMLEKKGANKDSIAAKRITDHVRRYQVRMGLVPARGQRQLEAGEKPAISLSAFKKVFQHFWNESRKDPRTMESEHRMLVSFYMRYTGVTPEQLDKWTNRELLRLAAAPLAAIDVTPHKTQEAG